MTMSVAELEIQTINIVKDVEIAAPIGIAVRGRSGTAGAGGRNAGWKTVSDGDRAVAGRCWYRDLGNDAGHLWGHVQVIKPPTWLELCGPMFMSYPAATTCSTG